MANPTPFEGRRALPLDVASNYAGISRATLYRLIDDGKITRLKIGRRTLIERSSLDRLLDEAAAA